MKKSSQKHKSKTYVAFLRGINVGGHKKVPMADLRHLLGEMGFQEVKTLLASGNVIFTAPDEQLPEIAKNIRQQLVNFFSFDVPVIVLPGRQISGMVQKEPFKEIVVTPKTRRYVTFLANNSTAQLEIPYRSVDGAFSILSQTKTAVFSVLDLAVTSTVKAMNILEKSYGKEITTRNWNTILKLEALLDESGTR